MSVLSELIRRIPGQDAYLEQAAANNAQTGQGIQQTGGLMALMAHAQEQQQKQQEIQRMGEYRSKIGLLGPNPDQQSLAGLAAQYAAPKDVMHYQQQSLDRKATLDAAKIKGDEDRALRLQMAADSTQAKRDKLEQDNRLALERITDARQRDEWNQQYKQQTHQLNMMTHGLNAEMKRMGMDIQRDRALTDAELKRQGMDLAREKLDATKRQGTDKEVQKLGAALEKSGLPEIDTVLGNVEKALTDRPDLAEYLSGPKSLLPDMVVDKDIATGRQAFQKLFNITLKNRSGSAVTNQELDRLKQEFATGTFKTPVQLNAAVDQARGIINKHYASVSAGFGPDALEGYNENVRQFGGRVVLDKGTKAKPADAPAPPPGFKLNPP